MELAGKTTQTNLRNHSSPNETIKVDNKIENNIIIINFYKEVLKTLCNICKISFDDALMLIKQIKEEMKNSQENGLKDIYNYFNVDQIEKQKDYVSLLDMIIFCLKMNVCILFKSRFEYLNTVFLNSKWLTETRRKRSRAIYEELYTIYYEKKDVVTSQVFSMIIVLNLILYFKVGRCPLASIKNPPVTVFGIKSKSRDVVTENLDYALKDGTRLYQSFDVEAILAGVNINEIGAAVKGKLVIDLNCTKDSKEAIVNIKKYNFFYNDKFVCIRNCSPIYVGYFETVLGRISLYIIYPQVIKDKEIRKTKLLEIFEKIKNLESSVVDAARVSISQRIEIQAANKRVAGVISIELVNDFFKYLNAGLKDTRDTLFYFIEILGNKKDTFSDSVENLLDKMFSCLNINILPGLRIDLCVETWTNTPIALGCSKAGFSEIGIKPNYNICLSKSMNNYNKSQLEYRSPTDVVSEVYDVDDDKEDSFENEEINEYENNTINSHKDFVGILRLGFFEKVNFYSRYEDILKPVRNNTFLPEATLNLFKMNILKAHEVEERTVEKHKKCIVNMVEGLNNNSVSYRKEVRIHPIMLIDAVSILGSLDLKDYTGVETFKVNSVIKNISLAYIKELVIKPSEKLINTILFEYVFQHSLCFGNFNWHFIRPPLRKYLNTFKERMHDYTKDLSNNPPFEFKVDEKDFSKDWIIEYLILFIQKTKNSRLSKQEEWEKIFGLKTKDSRFRLVVQTMIYELTNYFREMKYYQEENAIDLNGECDKKDTLLVGNGFLKVGSIFRNTLLSTFRYQKDMNFKTMYMVLNQIAHITQEDFKVALINENIKYFFDLSPPLEKMIILRVDYEVKDSINEVTDLILILSKSIEIELTGYVRPDNVTISQEERIRMLYIIALRFLFKRQWNIVGTHAFLGTLHTRPISRYQEFIKNFKPLKLEEVEIKRIFCKAALYNPYNYSVDNIIDDVKIWNLKNDISFNPPTDFVKNYTYLYEAEKQVFEFPKYTMILDTLCKKFGVEISHDFLENFIKNNGFPTWNSVKEFNKNKEKPLVPNETKLNQSSEMIETDNVLEGHSAYRDDWGSTLANPREESESPHTNREQEDYQYNYRDTGGYSPDFFREEEEQLYGDIDEKSNVTINNDKDLYTPYYKTVIYKELDVSRFLLALKYLSYFPNLEVTIGRLSTLLIYFRFDVVCFLQIPIFNFYLFNRICLYLRGLFPPTASEIKRQIGELDEMLNDLNTKKKRLLELKLSFDGTKFYGYKEKKVPGVELNKINKILAVEENESVECSEKESLKRYKTDLEICNSKKVDFLNPSLFCDIFDEAKIQEELLRFSQKRALEAKESLVKRSKIIVDDNEECRLSLGLTTTINEELHETENYNDDTLSSVSGDVDLVRSNLLLIDIETQFIFKDLIFEKSYFSCFPKDFDCLGLIMNIDIKLTGKRKIGVSLLRTLCVSGHNRPSPDNWRAFLVKLGEMNFIVIDSGGKSGNVVFLK